MRDLSPVREAYERGEGSLRELAEKFLVAERTLFRRASAEKWQQGAAKSGSGIEESGSTQPQNGSAPRETAAKNGSIGENFGSTSPENGSGRSDFGSTFSQSGSGEFPAAAKSGSSRSENGSTRSIFDAQVTTYPNAMSPDCPAVDTVASVLHAIRTGEFRGQIESLRRILGRDGKAAYDRAKTKLPAFCASGTTKDRKRLLQHSNLLQIDFDGLNGQLADARRKMVADPHAAAVFTSPSGVGLKVLLRIDGFRHEESVAAAADYFPRTYGLKPDPQVKEPARLCFVSYDPDLFANPFSELLPLPEPAPKAKPLKNEKSWWSEFRGDLHTLDLVAAFREAGLLGECLDPDSGKWTVRCPWAQTHGDGGRDRRNNDSSTVIFAGEDSHAFKCLHAHCADRKLKDALLWIESEQPGLVDRHCKKLRSSFANEALKKQGLRSPWGVAVEGAEEALVEKNGSPFYYRTGKDGEREVTDFNPHYWTARFAFENLVIFEPHNNQFYSYQEETGIWIWQTDAAIRAELASWMLEYSRHLNQPLLETGRNGERIGHMLTILRAAAERRRPFRKFENVIHLKNCMVHLENDPPEIHSFSPHYFSLNQCQIALDPDADCPRFLNELVYPSIGEEDAVLLQLAGGLYLTGRNNWQKCSSSPESAAPAKAPSEESSATSLAARTSSNSAPNSSVTALNSTTWIR